MMKDIQDFFDGVDRGAIHESVDQSANARFDYFVQSGELEESERKTFVYSQTSEHLIIEYIRAYHEWLVPQLG